MSVKLGPATNLQRLDVLKDYMAPAPKIWVPMPDFSLTTPTEFQNVSTKIPFPLLKDLKDMDPVGAAMPAKHPAFSVVLMHLIPKFFADLTPIDWGWHREVLRRARVHDEALRIMRRVDYENLSQYLHELKLDNQVADLRSFYFERAKNRAEAQTDTLKESNTRAQKEMALTREHTLDVRDERAAEEFVRKLLAMFSPTIVTLKARIKKSRTEPTLAQRFIKKDQEITPFELICQIAFQEFPLIRKEQIRDVFAKFADQLNQINLRMDKSAYYRLAIHKLFNETYFLSYEKGVIGKKADEVRHFKHVDYNNFILERRDATTARTAENLESYLQELSHNRQMFQDVNEQIKRARVFKDNLAYAKNAASQRRDDLERLFPVLIEGQTEHVAFNPMKFRTQFGLIQRWIEGVHQQDFRADKRLSEYISLQAQDYKNDSIRLNEHTLRDAREAERMREANMVKDYFRQFDLRDTMAAFVSLQKQQAEELKLAMYAKNDAAHPSATENQQQAVAAVHQTKSFKTVV